VSDAERHDVSLRAILLGNVPRLARDAIAPVAVFYVGWKLVGLVVGIAAATLVTILAFMWERRHARTGLGASIGLSIALVQALTGLLSGSARWYFAPQVIANTLGGLVFLGSVVVGRPLAGVFASESYPFPPEVKASSTFRRVFGRISLAWSAYLLARGALRLVLLVYTSVEAFLLVSIATGIPLSAALTAWSFWYGVRALRHRSPSAPRAQSGTS
jgi:intracellular septation protein A